MHRILKADGTWMIVEPIGGDCPEDNMNPVSPAVNYVAPCYVSMVCSLLMTSGLVMLGRFPVMACGMRQML